MLHVFNRVCQDLIHGFGHRHVSGFRAHRWISGGLLRSVAGHQEPVFATRLRSYRSGTAEASCKGLSAGARPARLDWPAAPAVEHRRDDVPTTTTITTATWPISMA